jgi:hypothetical protein
MTKRIFEANKLKIQYENENKFKYDIVIRIRPDLLLKNKIPSYLINNIKKNTLYAPKVNNMDIIHYMKYFICDQMNFGSSETMDIFSNFYLEIDKYKKHTLCERMLFYYIKNNKVDIEYYHINFLIYEEIVKLYDISNNYNILKKLSLKVYQIMMYKFF